MSTFANIAVNMRNIMIDRNDKIANSWVKKKHENKRFFPGDRNIKIRE